MKRLLPLLVLATAVLAGAPAPAAAHPMGNFSINHYTAIMVASGGVRLLYVIDMAEIPTFQELGDLNAGHRAHLSPVQRAAYLSGKARDLAAGLRLRFSGSPLRLTVQADDLLFPPGAGGLPTERIYLLLQARLPGTKGVLRFQDTNFPGSAGWKEIVAGAGPGATLRRSSVPIVSRSHALTIYPSSVDRSPPQDLAASLTLAPGPPTSRVWPAPSAAIRTAEEPLLRPDGRWSALAKGLTRAGPKQAPQANTWAANRSDPLTGLMGQRRLPLSVLLLSLVVAFWFGAGHALSPGHGKTVVAAYLVGSRGTAAQAAILGLTVTATHTAGVFALGLVTLYLSSFILPDQLYPSLGFISGALVAGMGLTLFVRRLRALRHPGNARGQEHYHDGHAHHHDRAHGHSHLLARNFGQKYAHLSVTPPGSVKEPVPDVHRHGPFGRPHSHAAIEGSQGVSLRALLALGVSGGLLPCPSALVVLLSAVAFHRLAFGMILIVAFSLGLATTLTGVGILVVYGSRFLARLQGARSGEAVPALRRAVRTLPVLSALVIASLGGAIALGALDPGMLPSVLTKI